MWQIVRTLWTELGRIPYYHDEAERRGRALRQAAARSEGREGQTKDPLSFIIRVQPGGDGTEARVRGQIVHVGAGTGRLFEDLNDAMTFIQSAVGQVCEPHSR